MWKDEWSFLSGMLVVTVEATYDTDDADDVKTTFTFETYAERLDDYDSLAGLEHIANIMARLRNYKGGELKNIEEKKGAAENCCRNILLFALDTSLKRYTRRDYEKFYEASKTLTYKLQNEILNGRIDQDVGLMIWSVLDTVVDIVKYTPDSEAAQ